MYHAFVNSLEYKAHCCLGYAHADKMIKEGCAGTKTQDAFFIFLEQVPQLLHNTMDTQISL
jgi:hypothetical protein